MTSSTEELRFVDLQAQRQRIAPQLSAAIEQVLSHGRFIMGPEVTELERELTTRTGAGYAITCSSGTEALFMVLLAWNIGPGDAVFMPSFTFAATAEAAALCHATPFFTDVDENTLTMDVQSLERSVAAAKALGLRPRVVTPVDLFGHPADYPPIAALAEKEGMLVLADAAQSFGAAVHGCRVGTLAGATTTSFFPAKPLGCYGDGGAIFTDDEELAMRLRSIRVHGKGATKYENVRIGVNGRLDTLQAAVLLEKLKLFDEEQATRQATAGYYSEGLASLLRVPGEALGVRSAWAQYTVQTEARDELRQALEADRIPTAIYYPAPLHEQIAYDSFPYDPSGLTVTSRLAATVLSLPVHPYLTQSERERVVTSIHRALN